MTNKEVLQEIMNLIDAADAEREESAILTSADATTLDSLVTDIYMLCENAVEN